MINNEMNKITGSDIYNTSNNDLNVSTRPTTFQKKYRKDAKGNLIIKRKININIKKTKHHINFIDKLDSKKDLVTIINIESYKKYNLENENEEEEEDNKIEEIKQLQGEKNIVTLKGCCVIL